ncbi:27576_t:CDS:2 [Dentiscutata erythropus]|uniref:27576_t:CDS:1 n=1 Tax=Dentiscutata erythropus TaxID=1348616 RepID=A0A9N8V7X3_9GLOM|nr:27576_t:CDS:2 [Dentiscutata erythropus]
MSMLQEIVSAVKNNGSNNSCFRPANNENQAERTRRPLVCFIYQQAGHYTRECPNQNNVIRNPPVQNQGDMTEEQQDQMKQRFYLISRLEHEFIGQEIRRMEEATEAKVSAMSKFPRPKNLRLLRGFWAWCIEKKFEWKKEQNAFEKLKSLLTMASILAHPRDDKRYVLYMDVSHLALSAVLLQQDDEDIELIEVVCNKAKIKHKLSSIYHPQTNGLVKAYRTAKHGMTKFDSFYFTYRREVTLQVELAIKTYPVDDVEDDQYEALILT